MLAGDGASRHACNLMRSSEASRHLCKVSVHALGEQLHPGAALPPQSLCERREAADISNHHRSCTNDVAGKHACGCWRGECGVWKMEGSAGGPCSMAWQQLAAHIATH